MINVDAEAVISCLAMIISGISMYVGYKAYLQYRKKAIVYIYDLISHYKKFQKSYRSSVIYGQVDFFFDIIPITNNTTALTGDKVWIIDQGQSFDDYFRKNYFEIVTIRQEVRTLKLSSRSKKLIYMCDFSLLYLEYLEGMYKQHKRILDRHISSKESIVYAEKLELPKAQKNLEKMYKTIIEKNYLKVLHLQ